MVYASTSLSVTLAVTLIAPPPPLSSSISGYRYHHLPTHTPACPSSPQGTVPQGPRIHLSSLCHLDGQEARTTRPTAGHPYV
ncbi:hypothetical protein EON63_07280 [archaeon]|nr:MAG: hypothetical protein EON63_07280 [archaeon]